MAEKKNGLQAAVETVRALRAENGCPWDRAQTHESLRRYLLEESYEALEALDAHAAKPSAETLAHFKEELGDLLLQILLHAEISSQAGGFDILHGVHPCPAPGLPFVGAEFLGLGNGQRAAVGHGDGVSGHGAGEP